jgi:subtilase family serine protease
LATGNGPLCRGVPDVAALSGDVIGNGYLVADQSGCCASGGGTSLSSPLWLGMWTRAQTAAAMAGAPGGLGFANETFYALGNNGVTRAHDFYDITLGFNGYPALTGWDYTSGFGPPQLTNLVSDALARAHLRPKP